MKHVTLKLTSLAFACALTACGGGGGGSSTPSTVASVVPVVADVVSSVGTLVATSPSSAYAANSIGASAFSALNAMRLGAGAGTLAESASVDIAAAAHAKYLTTNLTLGVTHTEDSTKTDYYATAPENRLTKAGYAVAISNEVIGGPGASGLGSDCMRGLLDTVYHGITLLGPYTDVGFGTGTDGAGSPTCIGNVAATTVLGQVPPTTAMVAYPYAGQSNVLETFYAGFEVPRPPVSVVPNATAGTPIIVSVRNADYLNFIAAGTLMATVNSFTLKDAGGNLVPAGILANSALHAGAGVTLYADSLIGEGFVVLVPQSPLAKGQVYTVNFSATLKTGGIPVAKNWTFTTNP